MPNLNAHLIKLKKIKVRSTAQIQHQLNSIEMINLAFKFTQIPFAIIHNNVVVFTLSLSLVFTIASIYRLILLALQVATV